MHCVFCQILAGELPASFVVQEGGVSAFMDIMPVNEGHVLVIPDSHHVALSEVAPETISTMATVAQRCATAILSSDIPSDGINLFLADGEAAGQEVFHCHLHVIPRLYNDGFTIDPNYGPAPNRGSLDSTAKAIADRY